MIVYSETKKTFIDDVISNRIEDRVLRDFEQKLGHSTSKSEIRSWKNSLMYMNNILLDPEIPADAGIHIEYRIPQTSKRIDLVITGQDFNKNDSAIIVELKQWSDVSITQKNGIVATYVGQGVREVGHPSYQAWTYAALLQDFNETVRDENIGLYPCAYLHNCTSNDVINHSFYKEHTDKAPSFIRNDAKRLTEFIKSFVKYGDKNNIMYRIDNGKLSPSKNLAEKLSSMLKGNQEFIMIDDQKLVYETVLELSRKATDDKKYVLIVEGGPGTGKSVVAINLLVELTNQKKMVQYVTKNAAPRAVYESSLTGSFKKSHITNLFKGSGSYTECDSNVFDVLLVDEAHRLNAKSGMFSHLGENQIKELINASNVSVFFLDENQKVTFKDIGDKQEIINWATHHGVEYTEMELKSQFRCNGSNGYLAWLDNILQIRETANEDINDLDYEFKVLDSPNKLKDLIFEKNKIKNKARIVAGYCWNWITKKDSALEGYDIKIPEHDFGMKWNLASDGNLWILKPESVKEIGCIHTCQGLELDYIGVIIGNDLIYRNGKLQTVPENRAQTDASLRGYVKLLKTDSALARKRADAIIKNTYRTLMTRGQKGCYIYCCDKETEEYFRKQLNIPENMMENSIHDDLIFDTIPDHLKFTEYLPFYELEAACGYFGEGIAVEEEKWIKVKNQRVARNMFVTQVHGKSMDPKIPDGSYCIFRTPVVGSRNNKIVLIQHTGITDPENGGSYSVKKYTSKKIFNGNDAWQHEEIVLQPLNNEYTPIVIKNPDDEEFIVVGEFLGIIG